MPTPVAHVIGGVVVGAVLAPRANLRTAIGVGALTAIMADLDFVPGALVGDPARFHQTASHSIAFALAIAAVTSALAGQGRLRWGGIAGLGYLSHLLLDFLTRDGRPPLGLPLLWPWSFETWASPVHFFPEVPHSTGPLLSLSNLVLVAREIGLLAPVLGLAVMWARRRRLL